MIWIVGWWLCGHCAYWGLKKALPDPGDGQVYVLMVAVGPISMVLVLYDFWKALRHGWADYWDNELWSDGR